MCRVLTLFISLWRCQLTSGVLSLSSYQHVSLELSFHSKERDPSSVESYYWKNVFKMRDSAIRWLLTRLYWHISLRWRGLLICTACSKLQALMFWLLPFWTLLELASLRFVSWSDDSLSVVSEPGTISYSVLLCLSHLVGRCTVTDT